MSGSGRGTSVRQMPTVLAILDVLLGEVVVGSSPEPDRSYTISEGGRSGVVTVVAFVGPLLVLAAIVALGVMILRRFDNR